MNDCIYYDECLNNAKCYRCFNADLFKSSKKGHSKTASIRSVDEDFKEQNKDDSWKDLEQKVADKINRIPTIKQARRSRMSGALWFETGDIVDDILHPECKEREGRVLKSGDRSLSIQKRWLEKAKEECSGTDKTMCLPFRFKGDDSIYCIFDMEDIALLITTMKAYMEDNDKLRQMLGKREDGI